MPVFRFSWSRLLCSLTVCLFTTASTSAEDFPCRYGTLSIPEGSAIESSGQRDGDYTLAIIHVVPSNVTYNADLHNTLIETALDVQAWYQVASGGSTWEFEYPTAIVETYFGVRTREYYHDNGDWWGSLLAELDAAGWPIWEPGIVTCIWAQGAGWWAGGAPGCDGDCGTVLLGTEAFPDFNVPAYSGGDCPGGVGGDAWPCTPVGAMAHELGHTLGLGHPWDSPDPEVVAVGPHSVMQSHWNYPDHASIGESPWGLLVVERDSILPNQFMHPNVSLSQMHENADIVNLPSNQPEMITEGSYTFGSGIPTDIALDDDGYVYIAGWGTGASGEDYWLLKLTNDLSDTVWVRSYNGPGNSTDVVYGMVTDGDGNMYVTGCSYGLTGNPDYCTIKYTSNGTQAWVQRYNGPANGWDYATEICFAANGNICVSGWSNAGTQADYLTILYEPDGDTVWTARYDVGSQREEPDGLAADNAGNVYVTGHCWRGSSYDWVTIKYNAAGDTLWTARYDGSVHSTDLPFDVAVDNSGNVYVTGRTFTGGAVWTAFTTIKYNASGVQQWANLYNGPHETAEARLIRIDSEGYPIAAGVRWMLSANEGGTGYDFCTIKYNPTTGDTLWIAGYSGPGNDRDSVSAMVLDADDNVYITGGSFGSNDIHDDFCTLKYDSDGFQLWVARYHSYIDIARDVAVADDGCVFVTGNSSWKFHTIKYCPAGPHPPRPRADFSLVQNGRTVACTNLSTNAVRHYWTFGDSGVSSVEDATHTYAEPGEYTVRLRVSDSGAYMDLHSQTVTVSGSCCVPPMRGNVDGSADNQVTMGDLTVLLDHLFITYAPLDCVDEANVDLSIDNDITMGDLTQLLDHLFISYNDLPPCP